MSETDAVEAGVEVVVPNEEATREIAALVASSLKPGDVVALSGAMGGGKTTFARAMIRHLAGDPTLDVPSPTFTLMQTYDVPAGPLVHLDLYRINSTDELVELGLSDWIDDSITLIEWPERADGRFDQARVKVDISTAPELSGSKRRIRISTPDALPDRFDRLVAFHRFMHESGFGDAERVPMQGDASSRIYERLVLGDRKAILMIAPRRPDGPPVRDGKPYSAIAHIAEDVTPFVAIARGLRERGFSAPEIYAADLAEGLLILEDLGPELFVTGDPPVADEERYAVAVDTLAELHRQTLPDTVPVAPSVAYTIPAYDLDAFLIEAELLLDWYMPHQERAVTDEMRESFRALWSEALAPALAARPSWVLRDYHSPNLIWLPEREGHARAGLIDFQDALMGPAAYDVASLLQDARVDVPPGFEDVQIGRYMKALRSDRNFDPLQFVELYALMGAQRATKILGIFARLDRRDSKPQYLRHQPRVWRNLRRSLAHATLSNLKAWYDANVPPPRT